VFRQFGTGFHCFGKKRNAAELKKTSQGSPRNRKMTKQKKHNKTKMQKGFIFVR